MSEPKVKEVRTLTVKDNFVYILTISDINDLAQKIPVNNGNYTLNPYQEGYVWLTEDEECSEDHVIQILNTRCGTGISGTYWDGNIIDGKIMKIFNEYIYPHLTMKFLNNLVTEETIQDRVEELEEEHDNGSFSDEDSENSENIEVIIRHNINLNAREENLSNLNKVIREVENLIPFDYHYYRRGEIKDKQKLLTLIPSLRSLHDYHNIPAVFYLTNLIDLDKKVSFTEEDKLVGGLMVWKLINDGVDIGRVVLAEEFINMMGDHGGVALMASRETAVKEKKVSVRGFGVFEIINWRDGCWCYNKSKRLELQEALRSLTLSCPYCPRCENVVTKIY